ncbi:hypothetical protein F5Y12DRAFT_133204 [Xylaria sp. FL1777]|nr:hypothetical protein F5Y12DRAFT_133204 [Xylaria sp. FL1777]
MPSADQKVRSLEGSETWSYLIIVINALTTYSYSYCVCMPILRTTESTAYCQAIIHTARTGSGRQTHITLPDCLPIVRAIVSAVVIVSVGIFGPLPSTSLGSSVGNCHVHHCQAHALIMHGSPQDSRLFLQDLSYHAAVLHVMYTTQRTGLKCIQSRRRSPSKIQGPFPSPFLVSDVYPNYMNPCFRYLSWHWRGRRSARASPPSFSSCSLLPMAHPAASLQLITRQKHRGTLEQLAMDQLTRVLILINRHAR